MKPIKTLTEKEFHKLNIWLTDQLSNYYTPPKTVRNELLIRLMLDGGLRVGEAIRLKWMHIIAKDKVIGTINVDASISKNKTSRSIPNTDRLSDLMKTFFYLTYFPSIYTPQTLLFARRIDQPPISARQVRRIVRFITEIAVGRAVCPHTLRHTFATRLMRVTNTRVIQELLGHKQLSSTQIYTHPNSTDLRDAIDKIG